MKITIVTADDHAAVRHGLEAVLSLQDGLDVVGQASDGLEAVALVQRLHPRVLITDLMMSGLSGLEVTRRVCDISPRTTVVVYSMHSGLEHVARSLQAGAAAYVVKDRPISDLLEALRQVARGERYISPSIPEEAVAEFQRRARYESDPFDLLTERERDVLQLVAEGLTSAEVAERLCLSPRTVEAHRASVLRKLGLRNHSELILFAVRRGLIAPIS